MVMYDVQLYLSTYCTAGFFYVFIPSRLCMKNKRWEWQRRGISSVTERKRTTDPMNIWEGLGKEIERAGREKHQRKKEGILAHLVCRQKKKS